jgi:DNA-binding MarR family transcriptional regulator
MTDQLPPTAEDLPPTPRLVWLFLRQTDEATQPEIAERTRTPQRTVRKALRELRDRGIVEASPSVDDPRQSHYSLTE